MVYDEIHGYALTATNPFFDDSYPKDHVFVDEFSCIGMCTRWSLPLFCCVIILYLLYLIMIRFFFTGCKNCANVCPDVFSIEEDFGRARACNQSGTPDSVQQAIESW